MTWLADNLPPRISDQEFLDLIKLRDQGDPGAVTKIVEANLGLILHVVKMKAFVRASNKDDLIQEGYFGLCRAAEKFDPSKGYKFSTYAFRWIWTFMSRHSIWASTIIRVPYHLYFGITVKEYRGTESAKKALRFAKHAMKVIPYETVRNNGDECHRFDCEGENSYIVDFNQPLIQEETLAKVYEALERVSERNRQIFLDYMLTDLTLEQVGQDYGITRERVRQIVNHTMKRVRDVLLRH